MTVAFFQAVFPLQSREIWVSTDGPNAEKDIARVWSSVIGKHLVVASEADIKSRGDFPFSGIYWSKVHPLKLSAKMHYRTGNNIIVTHVLSRSQSSLNSQSTWIRANIRSSIMHSVLHFIRPCPNWPGWVIFWFSSYMLRKLLVSLTKSTGFFLFCASNSFLIDNYFYRKRDSGREI